MQNRRDFLKGAAAIGAFAIVPASVLRGETAPSNQLTRALIGFGSIAHSANHLPFKGSRLIGLCDPYEARVKAGLKAAADKGFGKVKAYGNFLELLADKDVAQFTLNDSREPEDIYKAIHSNGQEVVFKNWDKRI